MFLGQNLRNADPILDPHGDIQILHGAGVAECRYSSLECRSP
jgi:hypothetical protein